MASIRRRGEKWEVSVRRRGCPGLYRSFSLIADARKWGREAETRLERNPFGMDPAVAKSVRFSDLLTRYRKEISPRKKGAGVESVRIRSLLMEPWTDASLRTLTPRIFADYRDRRVGVVSDETVRREIGLIRHVLNVAANEWGYPLPQNPIDRISLPKPSKARDRRLEADELDLAVKGKLYLAKQTHSANHQVRNRNGHAARRVNVHWLGGGACGLIDGPYTSKPRRTAIPVPSLSPPKPYASCPTYRATMIEYSPRPPVPFVKLGSVSAAAPISKTSTSTTSATRPLADCSKRASAFPRWP